MKALWVIGAVACLFAGGLGYFYVLDSNPVRFGSRGVAEEVEAWRLVIGFVVTLFGVCTGVSYRILLEKRKQGETQIESFKSFLSELFHSIDLLIGFCAAPLVFALIMQSTQGAGWPGLIAVALQNGFCCAIIADRFVGQQQSAGARRRVRS